LYIEAIIKIDFYCNSKIVKKKYEKALEKSNRKMKDSTLCIVMLLPKSLIIVQESIVKVFSS
jgi:hypothetical protein